MGVEVDMMAPPIGDNLGSFQRSFDGVMKGLRGDTNRILFESNSLAGSGSMFVLSKSMAAGPRLIDLDRRRETPNMDWFVILGGDSLER